jgi:hypothetical protein
MLSSTCASLVPFVALTALTAVVLPASIAEAQDSYTGCLSKGGILTRVNIGPEPASPCTGRSTQITWNEESEPQEPAVFCGTVDDPQQTGDLGGYTGAAALCQAACGSDTAHMCTASEMSISAQSGLLPPGERWYAAFSGIGSCDGWTKASILVSGTRYGTTPGLPRPGSCGVGGSQGVWCCDIAE